MGWSYTPGTPEWREHVQKVLADEQTQPREWWWLSFTDDSLPTGSQFLGVAIVEAPGMGTATLEAHRLGINPGGQVVGVLLPSEHVPPEEYRERLLTREEAEALD